MKIIDPNYQPPEQEYTNFPDGPYKVKCFEWFSLDEQGKPILVAQKDGKLVGRLKFTLLNGDEGPRMSLTLVQMNLLAKAFGVKNLPDVPSESYAGMVTKYMIDIRSMCQGKELEVESKNNWVNTIPGTEVPEGVYWCYISDLSSPERESNGDPKPKQGEFGSFFFVTLTVDSEKGHPSEYKGATFIELTPYAIEVNDRGEAEFDTIKEGKYFGQPTGEASKLSKLMRLAAPDVFGVDFVPPNPHNLLPYMRQKFLETKRLLEVHRVLVEKKVKGKTTRRLSISWPSLKEAPQQSKTEEPKRIIETMDIDTKCKDILVEALEKLADGKKVVNQGTYDFTLAGSETAKKYLSPLKKEGLFSHGSLEELTYDEIKTILTTLSNELGADYKDRVVALGIGIELKKEEDEDTPF
jgi:hypothetical protein